VYADPPINLQDIKNKITHACNLLNENQILAATTRECLRRFEACTVHNGRTFEQFINTFFLKLYLALTFVNFGFRIHVNTSKLLEKN
jgi:hypothetical protein